MPTQKRKTSARTPRTKRTSQGPEYAEEPAYAVRIVFEYDGGAVTVVSSERVEMLVPLSDPLHDYAGREGSWLELQSADGATVYRQVLSQMIPTDVEAPSDADGHPLMRRPLEHPKGIFVALLPDLESARTLVLCHQPAHRVDAMSATREALRIPFPPRRTKSAP